MYKFFHYSNSIIEPIRTGFSSSMATYCFLHFFVPNLFESTLSEEQKMITSLIVGLSMMGHNIGVLSSGNNEKTEFENNVEYVLVNNSADHDLENIYTGEGDVQFTG